MPVGVPKVPYQFSSEHEPEWADIYTTLSRRRVLFLCSDLKEELANQLMGLMLYLNGEDKTDDFIIYINSPGGAMTCGLGVYDIMNSLSSDVATVCVGIASSMASFVLAGGTPGKRLAFPNARIMIHQPGGGSQGQTALVLSEAEELVRLQNEVIEIYSYRTGQSSDTIKADLKRDEYMSAQESRTYGLVDGVAAEGVY